MKLLFTPIKTGIFCLLIHTTSIAAPYFTGPILAPSGITIPKGHINFELYGFDTKNAGAFNRHWRLTSTPTTLTQQINPLLSFGLSEFSDVQLSFPYAINRAERVKYHHIGDVSALLGFQVLRQNQHKWRPNLRVTLRETIPTGKFNQFDQSVSDADGTGSGSYRTAIALNFQHLAKINDTNYLRTRFILNYEYSSPVFVRGRNAYGGNRSTKGTIHPGNIYSVDLSGELTITKHWVAVMEAYYFYQAQSPFSGFRGNPVMGRIPVLSKPLGEEISLAPAIEFNFNEHIGIIAGTWFSIAGRSESNFRSKVIAINAYW